VDYPANWHFHGFTYGAAGRRSLLLLARLATWHPPLNSGSALKQARQSLQ
jgi:hypothetical protein